MPIHRLDECRPDLPDSCWVAPGAQLAGRVFLGEQVSVWFNAVIRADLAEIRIDEGSNVQDGCVLHVDEGYPLLLGARVTVGHAAILHGCTIEDDVLIGMGATILNGARVGRGSIVAAAALVREGMEIPPFSLVAGLPAIVKRTLPEEETLAAHRTAARHYAENALRYSRGLEVISSD